MTKEEFKIEFSEFCQFLNFTPNPTQIKVWFQIFEVYSAIEFKQAIQNYYENEEYSSFPMPAKVRQYCVGKGVVY